VNQLFPKPPKRKRQPTAECYREQLVLAADEIERLRTALDRMRRPNRRRFMRRPA